MNDDLTTVERQGRSRKILQAQTTYETPELREQYVRLTEQAQDAFLSKDFKGAKRYALLAMRIRPTAHLFGLCAAVADAVGNFNEAADFRLLQAFQADDAELWKELLNEFLESSLWFKATVCLKRLSALAPPRSQQRHDIQLQLADLLVALGEHRSATRIYRNLWVQSDMKDFEVFATLSSLLFQLGRWNNLDELLRESTTVFLKNEVAKQVKEAGGTVAEDDDEDDDDEDGIDGISKKKKKAGAKRGRPKEKDGGANGGPAKMSGAVIDALLKGSGVSAPDLRQQQKDAAATMGGGGDSSSAPPTSLGLRAEGGGGADADETEEGFGNFENFDDLFGAEGEFLGGGGVVLSSSADMGGSGNTPPTAVTVTVTTDGGDAGGLLLGDGGMGGDGMGGFAAATTANDSDFDFTGGTTSNGGGAGQGGGVGGSSATTAPAYDPFIELTSPEEIRNYLSLINVHTELLNERGQFSATVQLILLAASHLRTPVLEMNADILLKLTIAHAYMGNFASAEGVVTQLIATCSPAQYGDVLFDAAETLSRIGAFALANSIYKYLLRYSRLEDANSSTDDGGAPHQQQQQQSVGLSPRYALRKGETIDMLRDRIDRDVALLFGIARCAANTEPFSSFQWYASHGLMTPPLLTSPTAPTPSNTGNGSGGFPTSPTFGNSNNNGNGSGTFGGVSYQQQQAAALARQHPAMAALLEIHEQLDPFHAPTRVLLSQLYRHEFRDYASAEKALLPQQALFKPDAFAASPSPSSSSLFVDPSQPSSQSQSLSNLNATMAQFALNNDPSLLRESGLQRSQCDVELILLYGDLGPSRAVHLLRCGVPFFDRVLTTAAGDDEDAESVIAGGKKSRAPSLSLPGLSRASSAIVPASRIAGSLAGDNGPATSTLLSTTRSIATSARSSAAGGKLLLRTRGVSAGSSYITSSATTALTVAGSKAGPASTVAEMMEGKDSTGIFRFHRTTAAMKKAVVGAGASRRGGGGGGANKGADKDVAAVGKRIRKAVKKMDVGGGGEGGDAAAEGGATSALLDSAALPTTGAGSSSGRGQWTRARELALKNSRAKGHRGGTPQAVDVVIRSREEILADQAPSQQQQKKRNWEVSSVGNLGDIALMEEVMMASDEEKEEEGADAKEDDDTARDDEGFLLPSALPTSPISADGGGAAKKKGTKRPPTEVVDDALPSIDDVIANNFSLDPAMAELFRHVTEGGKGTALPAAPSGEDDNGAIVAEAPVAVAPTADDDAAHSSLLMAGAAAATLSTKAAASSSSQQQQQQQQKQGDEKAAQPVTASLPVAQPIAATVHDKRPAAEDCFRLFGKSRMIRLVLAMMDGYSDIGDHTESKNFGVFFLFKAKDFFRRSQDLLIPIRLAVLRQALLSGDVTSAVRSTVSILQQEGRIEDPHKSLFGVGKGSAGVGEDGGLVNPDGSSSSASQLGGGEGTAAAAGLLVGTSHQRHLWETFAVLVNGGLKPRILTRLITEKGRRDFELLCILGNQHYNCGSFKHALRYYLIALDQRPRDPLLLFLVAISYLQASSRRTEATNGPIQIALYYLQEYYQVVASDTPSCVPEAIFNIARAYHFLSLYYLAEPLYVRVITMLEQEGVGRVRPTDVLAAMAANGGAGGEDSPFGVSLTSVNNSNSAAANANNKNGALPAQVGGKNSSFYGFTRITDDTPQIDDSIRKGFGIDESGGGDGRGGGVPSVDAIQQHRARLEMLLRAARYNLSMVYRKGGHNEVLALRTLSAVLQ